LLHYWDVHTPYNAPRRFRRYRGTDPEKQLSDRYSGAVRYVDEQIGRLVKGLRRSGQMENTLLVVTSDHGESHTEHGIYFDHHGLYDATTHVPLILHCPARLPAGRRLSGFVQHVDLVPTILEMAGIESVGRALDGTSLLPLIRGRAEEVRPHVYCEESYVQEKRALRNRRYKYITAVDGDGYCRYCHKVHGGVEELYDLREDPGETRNVVADRRDVAARMRRELEHIVTGLRQRRDSNMGASGGRTPAPLSEEEREELRGRFRSLGYHG
ncbi:MAG: sulfatase-like hydrolase/transferase, partial [Candidatus Brocadiia bacterium]